MLMVKVSRYRCHLGSRVDKRPLVVPADVFYEQQEVAPSGRVAVLGVESCASAVAVGGRAAAWTVVVGALFDFLLCF